MTAVLGAILPPFDAGFADARLRAVFRMFLGVLLFLFPFSLIFVPFDLLPHSFAWMSTLSIGAYGVVVLLSETRNGQGRRHLTRFILIGTVFFLIEWVGSATGIPFGAYTYTGTLAPSLAGVPIAMAFAWYTVLITSWRIAQTLAAAGGFWRNRAAIALGAGLLAMALDLVLEPMAAFVHGYWIWSAGTVPAQNYASWFGLSAVAVLVLDATDHRAGTASAPLPQARSALLVYVMQAAVFLATALAAGYVLPALIALALMLPALLPAAARLKKGSIGS